MNENILTEKCIACNGTGKKQLFDDKIKKWIYPINSIHCEYCKGNGMRKYYLLIDGNNFMKTKVYVEKSV